MQSAVFYSYFYLYLYMIKYFLMVRSSFLKYIYVMFILLPVAVFFWLLCRYSLNIPYSDDVELILNFLNYYSGVSGFNEKITAIFWQFNEHRLVINKLFVLCYHYLFGAVNIRMLIIIGNLFLFGLFLFLFRSFKYGINKPSGDERQVLHDKLLFFIPVAFFLFQPQYYMTIFWATASIEQLVVLFFSFMSIYCLDRKKTGYFIISAVFAIMAVFTNGNGMIVFLVGFFILLLQKRRALLFPWSAVMIISLCIYFYHYTITARMRSFDIVNIIIYFLIFTGSFMDPLNIMNSSSGLKPVIIFVTFTAGIAVVLYFILLIKKEYYKKNKTIYFYLVFLLISGAVLSVFRSESGVEQLFDSRYRIIPVLILVLTYMSLAGLIPKQKKAKYIPAFLIVSILFNLLSYCGNYGKITDRYEKSISGLSGWMNTKYYLNKTPERMDKILNTAIENKYYLPPLEK